VQELRFGDNDTLSALVATLVDADYLFLMTDVDALYTANPKVRGLSRAGARCFLGGRAKGGGGGAKGLRRASAPTTAASPAPTFPRAQPPPKRSTPLRRRSMWSRTSRASPRTPPRPARSGARAAW
jgi:hypothetical protein